MGIRYFCEACGNETKCCAKRDINYGWSIGDIISQTKTYDLICDDCDKLFRDTINKTVFALQYK